MSPAEVGCELLSKALCLQVSGGHWRQLCQDMGSKMLVREIGAYLRHTVAASGVVVVNRMLCIKVASFFLSEA